MDAVKRLFKHQPVLANVIAGFVVFSAGDVSNQMLVRKKALAEVDFRRTASMGLFGVGMNGVFLTYYYRWMDRWLGSGRGAATVFKKILVDEIIGAPICISAFFAFTSLQQGGSSADIRERFKDVMREKYWETWITDAAVWPAANVISFKYVSLNYRPLWVGLCQVGWNTYLTTMAYDDVPHEDKEEDASVAPVPVCGASAVVAEAKSPSSSSLHNADVASLPSSPHVGDDCTVDKSGSVAATATSSYRTTAGNAVHRPQALRR